jgi:hypothetical protein
MSRVTNITIGTIYTDVDTDHNAPVVLWNASDEDMTVRFGGGGDTRTLEPGAPGLQVFQGVQTEALCASGGKTLQVLRGVAEWPIGPGHSHQGGSDGDSLNQPGPLTFQEYGTVTVGAGTSAVTGSGTYFTYLPIGVRVSIGGEEHTVATITSDTAMTLASNHVAGASGVNWFRNRGNVALGECSLEDGYSGPTTADVVAVGLCALSKVTSFGASTAVGYGALSNQVAGYANTALGYAAGMRMEGGFNNAYIGNEAGFSTTSGTWNLGLGVSALRDNVSGDYNMAVGVQALKSNTATGNTAIGSNALRDKVAGDSNVAIGRDALLQLPSGAGNVAIGYRAGHEVTGATSNEFYLANNTGASAHLLRGNFTNQNLGLCGATDYQDGVKVMAVPNATTVPTTNPTGGGILYAEAGALKWRGSSGTVTTIANA